MTAFRSAWVVVIFSILLVASLFIRTPVLAQTAAPANSQYADCSSSEASVDACANVGDGIEAFSENAHQGTGAVNEAMQRPGSSAGANTSGSTGASVAGDENEASESDEIPASITTLPETGGASPATFGLGVLLVMLGLAARKVVG